MAPTHQIAAHLRAIHFGGNWTAVNLKEKLADVTWQQATQRVGSFHTIAEIAYHMNYYRCLHGPIEHCHYHLGQIALLKSMLVSF